MGRNLVKFKKNLMTASLIQKYDIILSFSCHDNLGSGKFSLFLCFCMDWAKMWCKG